MTKIIRYLKKHLTGGEEAISTEPLAATANSVCVAQRRHPASADKPLTSLTAAEYFAHRFLDWCARVGIHGAIDWPRLYVTSLEFAEDSGMRHCSKMALAKALSNLGVPKTFRDIADHERGLVSSKRHDAKRPRVTVYILPSPHGTRLENDERQLDLFD